MIDKEFNIEDFISKDHPLSKITDSIYNIDGEIIEVLDINYDLKKIKIRHNHNTHYIQFKNKLDLTLDKMGIKRTFEAVNTDVKAPMPGKVLQIMISAGDIIEKGQPLLILEAMKMENVLKSDCSATIKSVNIHELDSVESGQLLIELDPIV